MSYTPIAGDEAKGILADYAAGITVTQLGKKYQRQNCMIVKFLRREGVFVKKPVWDKSNAKLTPELIKKLGEEYQLGAVQEELAARHGISTSLVRNALRKAGVAMRGQGRQPDFKRVSGETAYCSGCDLRKSLSEFHQDKSSGLPMYLCKECQRWARRLRVYGVSKEQYSAMFLAQEGKCAVCGTKWEGSERHPDLVVDHDHATGKIRGLLCPDCNQGLGHAKDSKEVLAKAIAYLQLHAAAPVDTLSSAG
jgi:hypothetical protein